jgi:hypothetical protein
MLYIIFGAVFFVIILVVIYFVVIKKSSDDTQAPESSNIEDNIQRAPKQQLTTTKTSSVDGEQQQKAPKQQLTTTKTSSVNGEQQQKKRYTWSKVGGLAITAGKNYGAYTNGGTTHLLLEGSHKLSSGKFDAWSNDDWDVIILFKGWALRLFDDANDPMLDNEYSIGDKTYTNEDKDFKEIKLKKDNFDNKVSAYRLDWLGELPDRLHTHKQIGGYAVDGNGSTTFIFKGKHNLKITNEQDLADYASDVDKMIAETNPSDPHITALKLASCVLCSSTKRKNEIITKINNYLVDKPLSWADKRWDIIYLFKGWNAKLYSEGNQTGELKVVDDLPDDSPDEESFERHDLSKWISLKPVQISHGKYSGGWVINKPSSYSLNWTGESSEQEKMESLSKIGAYAINGGGTTLFLSEGYFKLTQDGKFNAYSNNVWDDIYLFKGWKITVYDELESGTSATETNTTEDIKRFTLENKNLRDQVSSFELEWVGF